MFWKANGFEPQDRGCSNAAPLLAPAQRRDVEQNVVACWRRIYPGWLFFPASGSLFGREVMEDGKYVIYIYSNGRESEATEVAENLQLFLGAQCPGMDVVNSQKHFVDFR